MIKKTSKGYLWLWEEDQQLEATVRGKFTPNIYSNSVQNLKFFQSLQSIVEIVKNYKNEECSSIKFTYCSIWFTIGLMDELFFLNLRPMSSFTYDRQEEEISSVWSLFWYIASSRMFINYTQQEFLNNQTIRNHINRTL